MTPPLPQSAPTATPDMKTRPLPPLSTPYRYKGKMENTVISDEDAEEFVVAAMNLPDLQDSSWLDIDHFPDSDLWSEKSVTESKCHGMGNIEGKSVSDRARTKAKYGSQDIEHNTIVVEDGPWDEVGVEQGGEDMIADPEVYGIEMDDDGYHSKDDHKGGVLAETGNSLLAPTLTHLPKPWCTILICMFM